MAIELKALMSALHALGAVVWVGGMFVIYTALRPAAAENLDRGHRLTLWAGVLRRFFAWVWAAMIVLVATGFEMIFVDFGGFGMVDPDMHVMTTIGLVMAVIFLVIFFGPYRAMRQAVHAHAWDTAAHAHAWVRRLVAANLVLGLINVAIGAGGRFL